MKKLIAVLIVVATFFLSGCGLPNENDVTKDFKEDHPKATVLFVGAGEGDSDNVYFHIKYSENGIKNAEVWLYQRDRSTGKWSVSKKGLPDQKY